MGEKNNLKNKPIPAIEVGDNKDLTPNDDDTLNDKTVITPTGVVDSAGIEFNPTKHKSIDEKTKTGRWKRKPITTTKKAGAGDAVMALIEDACNNYIDPEPESEEKSKRLKRVELLDNIFSQKFDDWLENSGGEVVDKINDKLVLIGVPLYYIIKAMSQNMEKTSKLSKVFKKTGRGFGYLWYKIISKVKNKKFWNKPKEVESA